jgi:hypothetical protein
LKGILADKVDVRLQNGEDAVEQLVANGTPEK